MALTVLTSNATIYVRTTGSDTTGDGSSGSPYASVGKAIEHIGDLWMGDYTVTVDIGAGVFSESTFTFEHPFGKQVTFQGVDEDLSSVSVSSIDSSKSTSGAPTGLCWYQVSFTLPVGKSVSVGDFILVRTATGGTSPEHVLGCHEVTGWVSGTRVATVKVYVKNITSPRLPSGSITCNLTLAKTVLSFSAQNGLKVQGPFYAGIWNHLVMKGSNSGSASGLWALNGGMVSMGSRGGISGFQQALYAQNNATIFADYAYLSKTHGNMVKCSNSGVVSMRDAVVSGPRNSAIYASVGGTVYAFSIDTYSGGGNALYADSGSYIYANSTSVLYANGAAFCADGGGYVWAGNVTTTGCGTPVSSPTYDTVGNDNSYVNN
jgi:hypothetical protein